MQCWHPMLWAVYAWSVRLTRPPKLLLNSIPNYVYCMSRRQRVYNIIYISPVRVQGQVKIYIRNWWTGSASGTEISLRLISDLASYGEVLPHDNEALLFSLASTIRQLQYYVYFVLRDTIVIALGCHISLVRLSGESAPPPQAPPFQRAGTVTSPIDLPF